MLGPLLKKQYVDTLPKKMILVIGVALVIVNTILQLKLQMTPLVVIGAILMQLLYLWLSLYGITCLRDGKCVFYSNVLAVVAVIVGVVQLLGFGTFLYLTSK